MDNNKKLSALELDMLQDIETHSIKNFTPIDLREDVDCFLQSAVEECLENEQAKRDSRSKKKKKYRKKPIKTESRQAKANNISAVMSKKAELMISMYETAMTNVDIDKELKSPLRWAGGKSLFYKRFSGIFEFEKPRIGKYIEPFLGSGACLFGAQFQDALVGDINKELVNFYSVIKSSLKEFLIELSTYVNSPIFYKNVRDWDRESFYSNMSPVKKAARFYYINRMGFNGLYRVNSAGQINTPYGYKDGPFEADIRTLVAVHKYLNKNNIQIVCSDFRSTIKDARVGDFVYFDPPMYNNSFRDNADRFTANDYDILKLECDILTKKDVSFLLTTTESRYVRELFHNYTINTYKSHRKISAKGSTRSGYDDIIIKNF